MEQKDFIIEQINTFSPELAEDIRSLTKQIGDNYKELTNQDMKDMLDSSTNHLIVARHGNQVVGMVTLLIYRIPYVKKAYLDDLIVDAEFRGHGLGSKLLEKALEIAKEKDAAYIDFTSRPRRVAGNTLYEKLGFKKRDTNVYRLILSYEEV
jgi:ribosomal protein S18 acetylase RimI-like enzyme